MNRKARLCSLAFAALVLGACDGPEGPEGPAGPAGAPGPDGSQGDKGDPGANGDAGAKGDPGSEGDAGRNGTSGLNAGQTRGLAVALQVSAPANGTHFVAGEQATITITLADERGLPVELTKLARARLMVAGPMDATKTKAAIALMKVSGDYAASEHHYVDLQKSTSPNLVVKGNVITYRLEPVTSEDPGTYLVGLWAGSKDYPLDQAFPIKEIQIGTSVPETQVTDKSKCAACHQGAANGRFYFAHIDPGYFPVGDWSLDSDAIRTCKLCHNTAGYATICKTPGATPCDATNRLVDPIMRRVHGVHRGKGLKNPFNVDPTTGDFRAYSHVVFPADLRLCTKCHTNDAWKNKPRRDACGTCHDNVDFAAGTISPPRVLGTPKAGKCTTSASCATDWPRYASAATCNVATGACELGKHMGGVAADSTCATCHTADDSGPSPIPARHGITPLPVGQTAELSFASPPANGSYFVAGEKPKLKVVLKNRATPAAIVDPATWTMANVGSFRLFVHGPRSFENPVLTFPALGTAAIRAAATGGVQPYNLSAAVDLQVAIDGGAPLTIPVAAGTFANRALATAAEVATWLNADAAFKLVARASTSGTRVVIKSNAKGTTSTVEVLASTAASPLGFAIGKNVPTMTGAYVFSDLRIQSDPVDEDPWLTRVPGAAGYAEYQLADVASLKPGTYSATAYVQLAGKTGSWAKLVFQVGTAKAQELVATNCADCHESTRMHVSYLGDLPFEPDFCHSCHDYQQQILGQSGWGQNNNGFGAGPFSRRIHGVHFGRYLDKPLEIHPTYGPVYAELVFPQDVRNCTKCHAKTDTWKKTPSRLSCLGCHDSDAAIAHGTLNTIDPTPAQPYSGDEHESCSACHDDGRAFSATKTHDISSPYVPPYPREPAK